jgi:hypothetical protein
MTGVLHFYTGSSFSPRLTIDAAGQVGIGVNPTSALHVSKGPNTRASIDGWNVYWNSDHTTHPTHGDSTTGSIFYGCQFNGNFIGYIHQNTSSSIAIHTSSDYRLKENIMNMPSMLDRINQLNPIQFNYLDDKQNSLGFLAHEFKEVFHDNAIVNGEKDGVMDMCENCNTLAQHCRCEAPRYITKPDYQGMDYGLVTPICIKGIQELSAENEVLKEEMVLLKEEIMALGKRLELIEVYI